MYPHTSYIIYGTQRSGTTLLCEALSNTGIAGKPEEYFTPFHVLYYAEQWGVPLRSSLADSGTAYFDAIGEAYFQGAYNATSTPKGFFEQRLYGHNLTIYCNNYAY